MYENLTEEALKSKIREDFFDDSDNFEYTQIKRIDFVIARKQKNDAGIMESFLWAEAKQGTKHDLYESFVQLILTIGCDNILDQYFPPKFIGAFDAEKIAFIEFDKVQSVFYQNDFNWKVTPSNHKTKEFKQLYKLCEKLLQEDSVIFRYSSDSKLLHKFIRLNFKSNASDVKKIAVTKNNFISVFNHWNETVKDSIAIDWKIAEKNNILPTDFFLADLLSENNETMQQNLNTVLRSTKYEFDKQIDVMGSIISRNVGFKDGQKAHHDFWAIYERPPREEYREYILMRRDLLIPQKFREKKGCFYTPEIWVEKSQEYIADVLGENWQDEYYVWDNSAGSGNLLNGLTNYRNVWASTLDKSDVDIMLERIQNGWQMFENHIFQFDFLNDDFIPQSKGGKMPDALCDIINDPKKREKLVVYINPPYAEASSYGENSKPQVANLTECFRKFHNIVGAESLQELSAQFFIRIFKCIPNAILATFATPKFIVSEKFNKFREVFKSQFHKGFVCKSSSFDNVDSEFPIGFYVVSLDNSQELQEVTLDVMENNSNRTLSKMIGHKTFLVVKDKSIREWRQTFYDSKSEPIGYIIIVSPAMQSNHNTYIKENPPESYKKKGMVASITNKNLIEFSVYMAIRQSIKPGWQNNLDQFLYPDDGWKDDKEFQSDCLVHTLFNNQNKISSHNTLNHWIPFSEQEVGCKKEFKSHFMHDFINGRIEIKTERTIFEEETTKKSEKLKFSEEAQAVFDAGKELWKYYHSQPNTNPDASFYDIKMHFKGKNDKGSMNIKSKDERFCELIDELQSKLNVLAAKIAEKVYKYGFLK